MFIPVYIKLSRVKKIVIKCLLSVDEFFFVQLTFIFSAFKTLHSFGNVDQQLWLQSGVDFDSFANLRLGICKIQDFAICAENSEELKVKSLISLFVQAIQRSQGFCIHIHNLALKTPYLANPKTKNWVITIHYGKIIKQNSRAL